ncbi:MAG: NAD(P)-dependent oxidoreductase [Geminicoccaceae bacterium]|nr:NAD(P)-dependent oxidoreductase [Geminicoccaceae bacterium]
MRALVTGVSSFTGAWFALALVARGFAVTGVHRRARTDYPPEAQARLALLEGRVALLRAPALDSEPVRDALARERPRLLCLHGAEVGAHRAAGFDVLGAVARTTAGIDRLLDRFAGAGGRAVLVTGSVFEAEEGRGAAPLRAVNPYGLAKTLTWQVLRFAVERRNLALGKFVVAHPVGPFDKPTGLVPDLLAAWRRGEAAVLRRPRLVRDFLAIDGLAAAYARAALALLEHGHRVHLVPSLWPEPVRAFARRLSAAIGPRLSVRCTVREAEPPEPSEEPTVRTGLHDLCALVPAWDPEAFWNAFARSIQRPLDARETCALVARACGAVTSALATAA